MPIRIVSVMPRVYGNIIVNLCGSGIVWLLTFQTYDKTASLIFPAIIIGFGLLGIPVFLWVAARFQRSRQRAANRDDAYTHIVAVPAKTEEQSTITVTVHIPQSLQRVDGFFLRFAALIFLIGGGWLTARLIFATHETSMLILFIWAFIGIMCGSAWVQIRHLFDCSIYQVSIDSMGVTVARRVSKRFIPWQDIRLVYDVAASHRIEWLNRAWLLRPYFGRRDQLLFKNFNAEAIRDCYEIASAKTRIIIPIFRQGADGHYQAEWDQHTDKTLIMNENSRFTLLDKDYATYLQRMDDIMATIVERSGVEVRARNLYGSSAQSYASSVR